MTSDLVVIGGGPAGLATAIDARLAGLSVVVLDGRALPLDKACGEGIMPAGVRALVELGVELAPEALAPIAGVRFVDGGDSAIARFAGVQGWGVRRIALVGALVRRARDLGADLRYGTRVTGLTSGAQRATAVTTDGSFAGSVVVGADGLHSFVRRWMWGPPRPSRRPRYGMRRHFARPPWSDLVEVHFGPGFEVYVTPVGRDTVGVAVLGSREVTSPERYGEILRSMPAVWRRLAGAPPFTEPRGAGPFMTTVPSRVRGRVALVGDAAGYVDALTGEGLGLAWRSARALVRVVAAGRPLAHYETAYRRASRSYVVLTRLELAITRRPALRGRMVRALAREPEAFARLVAALGDEGPLPLAALARLVPALLVSRDSERVPRVRGASPGAGREDLAGDEQSGSMQPGDR